jgi:hypothetical protein
LNSADAHLIILEVSMTKDRSKLDRKDGGNNEGKIAAGIHVNTYSTVGGATALGHTTRLGILTVAVTQRFLWDAPSRYTYPTIDVFKLFL